MYRGYFFHSVSAYYTSPASRHSTELESSKPRLFLPPPHTSPLPHSHFPFCAASSSDNLRRKCLLRTDSRLVTGGTGALCDFAFLRHGSVQHRMLLATQRVILHEDYIRGKTRLLATLVIMSQSRFHQAAKTIGAFAAYCSTVARRSELMGEAGGKSGGVG